MRAEAEEPLYEGKKIEIKTKAKEISFINLKLKNPIENSHTFKVSCDIPDSKYEK